eukprot:gene16941-20153_t
MIECLRGLLHPSHTKECEARLDRYGNVEGCGALLAEIATTQNTPPELRQLAAIVLKKYIKEHWEVHTQDSPFTVASTQEKQRCVSMPRCKDANLLHGAVKCLEILCNPAALDDQQIKLVVVAVFPVLLRIISDTTTSSLLKLLAPTFPVWVDKFVQVLSVSATPQTPHVNEVFTMQTNAIESFTSLLTHFPKLMAKHLPALLPPIWNLFVAYQPLYYSSEVIGQVSLPSLVDEGVTRIDSLVSAMLEFLVTVITKKNRELFRPHLQAIVHHAMLYMQMTNDLVDMWESEPSQFLETEDDSNYHPRVIASSVLQAICEVYGKAGLQVLFAAVSSMLQAAEQRDNPEWWRMRESSILALTNSAASFIHEGDKKFFDFSLFLRDFLAKDFVETTDTSEFRMILQGQSLCCASAFAAAVQPEFTTPFLSVAVSMLTSDTHPLPLKMTAMKAIAGFTPKLPKHVISSQIPSIFIGTTKLLTTVTEDCLLVVLDTILVIAKVDGDLTTKFEPHLTPALLNMWTNFANDPLVSDTVKKFF